MKAIREMKIGSHTFTFGKKVYVMGILNITPDSFSDGGKYRDVDFAIRQVEKMIEDGVSIIDVGGESTRPGHRVISEEEEIARVVPVIHAIKKRFDIPISIDSYKSKVVSVALETGVDMVNDIWGLKSCEEMASIVAKYQVPICLMHNRKEAVYESFLDDVISDLKESISIAHNGGILDKNIILDPGIGFGKSYEQNWIMISNLESLVALGYPVLLAASRKSFLGQALDLPVNKREEGTLATSMIGAMKGCGFVRVHDVKINVRGLKVWEAMNVYGSN